MKYNKLLTIICSFLSVHLSAQNIQYGTGHWNRELYGNHRVVLSVDSDVEEAWAHIPWQRQDTLPGKKDLILIDASTGKEVANLWKVHINGDYGDIVFQPTTGKGTYYLYYLPYRSSGNWWLPSTLYLSEKQTYDTNWIKEIGFLLKRGNISDLPIARVLRFESINDFNSFYPMETAAMQPALARLIQDNKQKDFLIFPEDRKFPIRMTKAIPERWIKAGVTNSFTGTALRNEFYVFQLGLFAPLKEMRNVRLGFSDLADKKGNRISASSMRCFNLGGKDWMGEPFIKKVNVQKGNVQALWVGMDIAKEIVPGIYEGQLTVEAEGLAPQPVKIHLKIKDEKVGS